VRRLLVPLVLPIAVNWVHRQEARILASGRKLDRVARADAEKLGILDPDRVRVLHVSRIPLPGSFLARFARPFVGTSFQQTSGLSARYGIYVRADLAADRSLLAHELTHTRQYEALGGVRPFLRQYLTECLVHGYFAAPMEEEARQMAVQLTER
jgi:hypothetical protein